MRTIVHIGLPRCATTALQTGYFPAVAAENPGLVYAGTVRPRPRRMSSVYRAFLQSLHGEGQGRALADALARTDADTVLLSDATVTVAEPGATWRTKLARLARALEGIDHTILVGLRDPAEAVFSSYADIYHALPGPRRSVLKAAASPAFEIFQYRRLFRTLFELFDESRVIPIAYGDIVAGRHGALDAALGVASRERALPHLGRRHRTETGIRTGRLSLEQTIAYGLSLRLASAARPLVERLPCQMRTAKIGPCLTVPYPSAAEAERLVAFYAPHADFLRDRFGLDDGHGVVRVLASPEARAPATSPFGTALGPMFRPEALAT
jgi:hypothetical protein